MKSTILLPLLEPSPLRRRLVLGAALVAALVVWMPPRSAPARAEAVPSTPASNAAATALAGAQLAARVEFDSREKTAAPADATKEDPGAGSADRGAAKPPPETATEPMITVEKDGRKVQVFGLHSNGEYDSFNELIHEEPWLGALIFFSVAMVFLVPLLVVLALVWYKTRKNRMLNEAMLKLAERGIVPPAEAIDSLAGNAARWSASGPPPASAALYQQAREIRRRTAWSDLRKGVVLGAIGAALTMAGIVNDGEASGIGLVLLFVGIGYVVLWRFEQRALSPAAPSSGEIPRSGP